MGLQQRYLIHFFQKLHQINYIDSVTKGVMLKCACKKRKFLFGKRQDTEKADTEKSVIQMQVC